MSEPDRQSAEKAEYLSRLRKLAYKNIMDESLSRFDKPVAAAEVSSISALIALLTRIAANQAQTNDLLAKLVVGNASAQVPSDWLSISEAANVVGLSTKTVRRAIGKGDLRATPTVPNARRPTWRIARKDLDAFMKANAVASPVTTASQQSNGKYKSRHFADL